MNDAELEKYLEKAVLPRYGDVMSKVAPRWKDHGKVGPDAWAHYFEDAQGREYVILQEDFPGSDYLGDDLTHEIIPCDDQASLHIPDAPGRSSADKAEYFTLYVEKQNGVVGDNLV